ncbi:MULTISPECIES: hypothetical protein [unclassified Tolypothrix]|uniref:hypothetical protein n=1 Tax=unclassified Tolypothrix TaxID=2649714 RepID=UPI0005F84583|nr:MULTISPECIES: hypothetical protein [unclassified Tolypothrix]MBE9086767.1 hypothetical protein [Tolypothrix sp. LEGE 11397]UYD27981.1 hypothetical protein HGR01_08000 [Tolypothrix sp. PCC 7712]UYD36148.1 hypothetical protein HG267_10635 [Tolypothrix sp. PCC 7601]BAY94237.1 hypothetical protein NIES3275_62820 [Microchaete diplosiphon NIES-3275]
MAINGLDISQEEQDIVKSKSQPMTLQIAQERLYSFLVGIVQKWQPDDTLQEFKSLFIDFKDSPNLAKSTGLYRISFMKKEKDFSYTIKRCFYILVNNWEAQRRYKYIHELIKLFDDYQDKTQTNSRDEIIHKIWLKNFINSQDYKDIKLLAEKYKKQVNNSATKSNWANRYTSYLLSAQAFDDKKPREQQEVARKLSRQMKDKFKFELAMYIARSQSSASSKFRYKNPSLLGDNIIRIIKIILVKKGRFSYENIANIFIKQTENQKLKDFKQSLQNYLFFTIASQGCTDTVMQQLSETLSSWKKEADEKIVTPNLFLRICNRLIDCLTIENGTEPSALFSLLISQRHPLTLIILLLKIILICENARSHLEIKIAHLIRYYENLPEEECQKFINFLEFFNITFAIYAENVEYTLIKINEHVTEVETLNSENIDDYRVFSQSKMDD